MGYEDYGGYQDEYHGGTSLALAVQEQNLGSIVRQEFGSTEIARTSETAAIAVAAQAKAAVEVRYKAAYLRPRMWSSNDPRFPGVREKILLECDRPGFAEVARYNKPIGKGVQGFSIRFAEVVARCMTNLFPECAIVLEDELKRIIKVSVTDLENNLTYSKEGILEKTVERSNATGREVISKRPNSYGKMTYVVVATEDELLNKQGSMESKMLRTLIMRHVPGDIQDEAEEALLETVRKNADKNLPKYRAAMVGFFKAQDVDERQVAGYIGRPASDWTPDDIAKLKAVATTIKEGAAKWQDYIEAQSAERAEAKAVEQAQSAADEQPVSGKGRGKRLKEQAEQTYAASHVDADKTELIDA